MQPDNAFKGYKIWGIDNLIYGPVELPTLVAWVREERVTPETWVFNQSLDAWQRAVQVPELAMFFGKTRSGHAVSQPATSDDTAFFSDKPGALRRIKVFADFSDKQLGAFVRMMEVLRVPQWTEVVKQNQPGDGMYFVMEGELRVRIFVAGSETTLVTLGPGDFFGEASLFDQGPRSADVIANQDCVLLKVSTDSFNKLVREMPELAAPFLLAMGRTLTARIRADNKRHRDSMLGRNLGSPPANRPAHR